MELREGRKREENAEDKGGGIEGGWGLEKKKDKGRDWKGQREGIKGAGENRTCQALAISRGAIRNYSWKTEKKRWTRHSGIRAG